jgi:hypothetical protein
MTPLEMSAIVLLGLIALVIIEISVLYVYHYYFLVPLFKLMSYQGGVEIPPSFEASFVPPHARKPTAKEPRRPLEGQALQEMMDKLTNAY